MTVCIIDGQGGGYGRALIERLKKAFPGLPLHAAGTNAIATSAMLKAGADTGATGENAVLYGCRHASLIVGPIGILSADAMYGEITPRMAAAVSESGAQKVLIPVSKCCLKVAGLPEKALSQYLDDAVALIGAFLEEEHLI